jgi:hypothetical protein
MAITLEQLQAQRDKILDEMGNPSHVQFESQSVTYRPQDELEAALRRVDAEIAKLQSPQSRQFTIQSLRGI